MRVLWGSPGSAARQFGLCASGRKGVSRMAVEEAILLEFDYGTSAAVERDVDMFERFYCERFGEDALQALSARMRKQYRSWGVLLCFAMALLAMPVLINASSVFAYILLLMGIGLGGVGCFFLVRAAHSEAYCKQHFDRLMQKEFAATRSVTKRVFHMRCTEEGIGVDFGTQTSIKQRRFRPYGEIGRIAATDDLIFIKGLTWVCREQMGDEQFRALGELLRERCPEAWDDRAE